MTIYQGGKLRHGQRIADVITRITNERLPNHDGIVVPFAGMLHVARRLPFRCPMQVSDISSDIVAFWSELQAGWEPPSEISSDEYHQLRKQPPSALKTFACFACSYNGKEWGGYRPRKLEGCRNRVLQAREQFQLAEVLSAFVFPDWPIPTNKVVYLDPPYRNNRIGGRFAKFDTEAFWKRAREWVDAGNLVFVSEWEAPDDWECVWETTMSCGHSNRSKQFPDRVYVCSGLKLIEHVNKTHHE